MRHRPVGVWIGRENGESGEVLGSEDADIAASWEMANREVHTDITWNCSDDESDDLVLTLSPDAYADLVARANRHCGSCSGCDR